MFSPLDWWNRWWGKNGFGILVILSILFILICWVTKTQKKNKLAGLFSMLETNPAPRKKRDSKKTENYCRSIVEDIFQKPFPSVRPDFLRNPLTGKNLECDMMNDELKVCIERQGEQHYRPVPKFHRDPTAFAKQVERDKIKRELLEKAGYQFIDIPYTVHFDILDQYIPHKLAKFPKLKPYVDEYYKRNGQN